jgi:hypothetical protein
MSYKEQSKKRSTKVLSRLLYKILQETMGISVSKILNNITYVNIQPSLPLRPKKQSDRGGVGEPEHSASKTSLSRCHLMTISSMALRNRP